MMLFSPVKAHTLHGLHLKIIVSNFGLQLLTQRKICKEGQATSVVQHTLSSLLIQLPADQYIWISKFGLSERTYANKMWRYQSLLLLDQSSHIHHYLSFLFECICICFYVYVSVFCKYCISITILPESVFVLLPLFVAKELLRPLHHNDNIFFASQ